MPDSVKLNSRLTDPGSSIPLRCLTNGIPFMSPDGLGRIGYKGAKSPPFEVTA